MLTSADMGTRQAAANSARQAEYADRFRRFRDGGGLDIPVKIAAKRYGVTERCIVRWRRRLRDEQEAGR